MIDCINDGWIDGWMDVVDGLDVWMMDAQNGLLDGLTDAQMDGCGWINVYMDGD